MFTIQAFHNVDPLLNAIRASTLMRTRGKARGRTQNGYRNSVECPEGQSCMQRLRCRWEGNVKMKTLAAGVEWINLTQDGVHW